jgi:hypothetical protein
VNGKEHDYYPPDNEDYDPPLGDDGEPIKEYPEDDWRENR